MRTSTEAFTTAAVPQSIVHTQKTWQCISGVHSASRTTRHAPLTDCSDTYRPQHAAVLGDGAKAAEDGEQKDEAAADEDHVDGDGVEVSTDDERQKRAIDGHPYSDT